MNVLDVNRQIGIINRTCAGKAYDTTLKNREQMIPMNVARTVISEYGVAPVRN